MKSKDVVIGKTYAVKISGKVVPVLIESGGCVRRTWATNRNELIGTDGRKMEVDSKTYAKFLLAYQDGESARSERGALKDKNLVTEWRMR
jgi:hypothetical protein